MVTPSPRRTPLAAAVAPRPAIEDVGRISDAGRISDPGRISQTPPLSPRRQPAAPEPAPLAASAVSVPTPAAALPSLGTPREVVLTPTATALTPLVATEQPRIHVSPEMTAPVSAEEVAAAAAAMNRVPTFPDSWPATDNTAAKSPGVSVSAASSVSVSDPRPKFDLTEGNGTKDVYLEDVEEPTRPLMQPPRTGAAKAAQQLAADKAAAESAPAPKTRPATIPFDAYPPSREVSSSPPASSEPASPRAMVVPREVENQPAFLSNLRPQKEKSGSGAAVRALLVLIVLAAGGYFAYSQGYFKALLKK